MSHDRTDRIPLAPNVPRCEPHDPGKCLVRGKCAAYQAAMPTHGGTMGDFLTQPMGGTVLCPGYVDVRSVRIAAAPAREVRPAIRGIA